MKTLHRSVAALELGLIFPAALFMTALFARNIQPQQYEPAHSAQLIVDWFASSTRIGLWLLLIAMPFSVLVIGAVTLFREWRQNQALRDATLQSLTLVRTHAATLLIGIATAAAAGVLAIVVLHVVTD